MSYRRNFKMKIALNKELKIELLKAIKDGYLDTSKVPDLVKHFKNIEPFLELMKEVTSEEYENENKSNNL